MEMDTKLVEQKEHIEKERTELENKGDEETELSQQLQASPESYHKMEQKYKVETGTNSDLKDEIEHLKADLDEQAVMEKAHHKMKEKLAEERERNKALQREMNDVQQRMATAQSAVVMKEITRVDESGKRRDKENENLKKEMDNLRKETSAKIEWFQSQFNGMKLIVNDLEQKRTELMRQLTMKRKVDAKRKLIEDQREQVDSDRESTISNGVQLHRLSAAEHTSANRNSIRKQLRESSGTLYRKSKRKLSRNSRLKHHRSRFWVPDTIEYANGFIRHCFL